MNLKYLYLVFDIVNFLEKLETKNLKMNFRDFLSEVNHIIANRKTLFEQIEQNLTVIQYIRINNNTTHNVYAADSFTSRGGSRTAATSKMERFVIIVNGFQPLTIITKRSILHVAAVLDPSMTSSCFCLIYLQRRSSRVVKHDKIIDTNNVDSSFTNKPDKT